jgi:dienelactone hydrolase
LGTCPRTRSEGSGQCESGKNASAPVRQRRTSISRTADRHGALPLRKPGRRRATSRGVPQSGAFRLPLRSGLCALHMQDSPGTRGSQRLKPIYLALAGFTALFLPPDVVAQNSRQVQTTLVLVPGAGGASPNDFLIRNKGNFEANGFSIVVALTAEDARSAAASAASQGSRVVLVGMSAGTPTVAEALASGAPVTRAVLVSGPLMPPGIRGRSVVGSLGTPAALPPTLVVHHRQDACPLTPPEGVAPFVSWSRGRARAAWVSGNAGGPCGPISAHGYIGQDGAAIAAISRFAR